MKYIVSQCLGEPPVAFVGVEDGGKDVAFVARLLHCHTVGFLKEVPCKVISAVFLKVCGIHIYRDTVIPGGIPAIIPVELFDRVQERLEKNKKAPAREKAEVNYLLTTKLYCGKCGAFMVGESGTSRTGVVHYYYKCVNAKRGKTCDKKTVQKGWIESFVVDYTMKTTLVDNVIERMADAVMELQQGENTVLPALKNQLKDTRKSIENIVDAIQNGMFHPSMKQRMDELEAAREQLEISIAQEEMQKPMLTKEQVIFWISRFKNGNVNDMAFRQRLIDTFVNAIYLYDDRIVLTYNYKDGSHTVTLAQVEETFGSEAKSGSDLGADAPAQKTVRCIRGSKCKEGICKTSQNWPKQVFALSVIGERGTHEAAAEGECELSEGQDI